MGVMGALGAFKMGYDVVSSLKGNKDKSSGQSQSWSPGQWQTSYKLDDYFQKKLGRGTTPYWGDRVSGMSDPEQLAQQRLGSFMGANAPEQWNWANTGLQNVMQNKYSQPIVDPSQTRNLYNWAAAQARGPLEGAQSKDIISDQATDQLYQRIKDQTLRELPDIQNTLANNANLRGMYFSGGHNQVQGDLLKDTSSRLLDTLANLKYGDEQARRGLEQTREGRRYDTLRDILGAGYGQQYGDISTMQDVARDREGRQFAAIPYAMQMGETQSQFPLEQAKAGMEYGQLPRQLSQQELDTRYQDWLRTRPEYNPAIDQALSYLAREGMRTSSASTPSANPLQNWNFNVKLTEDDFKWGNKNSSSTSPGAVWGRY